MKLSLLVSALSLSLLPALRAATVGKAIEYPVGSVLCEGWHAYDDALPGKRPGILVVHQWTGLSDYEKMRAEMLAGLGYNVFALDIYGKGVRPQPPASGKEAGKYKDDRALFRKRLEAGLQVLRGLPQTDPDKIAAIGYCFGGTGALELARSGAKIDGVVSFHGGLGTPSPDDARKVACGVLVLHGADDPFVPPGRGRGLPPRDEERRGVLRVRRLPGGGACLHPEDGGRRSLEGRRLPGRGRRKIMGGDEGGLREMVRGAVTAPPGRASPPRLGARDFSRLAPRGRSRIPRPLNPGRTIPS